MLNAVLFPFCDIFKSTIIDSRDQWLSKVYEREEKMGDTEEF